MNASQIKDARRICSQQVNTISRSKIMNLLELQFDSDEFVVHTVGDHEEIHLHECDQMPVHIFTFVRGYPK